MAPVTLCSDFGAPKNIKSVTVCIFSLSICHEVMGPDAVILVFWMLSFKANFFTFLFHFHQEPWFMDLTFQVPTQYCFFTASDFTSITSYIHSWALFLLWIRLFIPSGVISPLISSINWAPTDLGSSSFSVISFCLFIVYMGFSRQEYWSGLPFPSPVDHILSDLSTMTHPPWVEKKKRGGTKEIIYKTEVESQMYKTSLWLPGCGERVNWEIGLTYTDIK